MEIQQAIDLYHKSADEFSRGNPQPIKDLYSHKDDVFLANPFGFVAVGWDKVSEALDFASSKFSDGQVTKFQLITQYQTAELATIFEIEKWTAKVGDRKELSSFDLRVTTTFRKEESEWKVVHRHADPIATFNVEGPLRGDL